MDVNTPTISIPTAAIILDRPAPALRRFLVRHPDFSWFRFTGLQPRLSVLCLLRLDVIATLERAGLSETEALHVTAETVERPLYGLTGVDIPLPDGIVTERVAGFAWHIAPGAPPRVSRAGGSPPWAALSLTINLEALTAGLFGRIAATATTKDRS